MPGASLALFADLGACHVQKSSVTICVLPAPSGWRATAKYRLEHPTDPTFLSTPSGWRATYTSRIEPDEPPNFYPRPPGGGRPEAKDKDHHPNHFYPRPPGGGRHDARVGLPLKNAFLSTPSGWRATHFQTFPGSSRIFLSTPSGWRATRFSRANLPADKISIHALRVEGDAQKRYDRQLCFISIHALRVEGDITSFWIVLYWSDFYPRPPGGGRLQQLQFGFDNRYFYPRPPGGGRLEAHKIVNDEFVISIHALRVEGDWSRAFPRIMQQHFYPRPPGGGRHKCQVYYNQKKGFLSTPSGWRATGDDRRRRNADVDFYPRLPGGGRPVALDTTLTHEGISIHALRVEGDHWADF